MASPAAGALRVLVIDDDPDLLELIEELLRDGLGEPHPEIVSVRRHDDGLQMLRRGGFDVVLLDHMLGANTGLELLEEARRIGCDTPIIYLTNIGQREVEVAAMRAGAVDFLDKISLDEKILARSIHFALQQSRNERRLRARISQQGAVAELGQLALEAKEIQQLFDAAVRAVAHTLGIRCAALLEVPASGEDLVARASVGWPAARPGPERIALDAQPRLALRTREPVMVEDFVGDPRFAHPPELDAKGVASGLCVPVLEGRDCRGVICLYDGKPQAFSAEDVHFVKAVANLVAAAIGRRRIEQELSDRERLVRAIFEGSLDAILITDDGRRYVEANRAACALLGRAREEIIGAPMSIATPPGMLDRADAAWNELLRVGQVKTDWVVLRGDGTLRPAEGVAAANILPGLHLTILRDMRERHAAEEALRRSSESYRALAERLPIGIAVLDGPMFIWANPAWRQMFGVPLEEDLAGQPVTRFLPAWMHDGAMRFDATWADSHAGPQELQAQRHDGAEMIVEASLCNTTFDGRTAILAVVEDLTDKKKLQSRLLLTDRLASVGTLAAGVAHELNNPLAYVIANLGLVAEELGRQRLRPSIPSEVEKALAEAREGADRMRHIVRDLKTFSRSDEESRDVLDVRQVIESSVNMVGNEIRHRARLVRDYAEVPPVLANASRLGQVFVNLLINAAQSVPEGSVAENEIRVTAREVSGFIQVEISDTGSGIPEEVVGRVFDPFFTTKPIGVGTGLGLSICHGIVASLGGTIAVARGEVRGSRFTVRLPAAERTAAAAAVPAEAPKAGRRGRVLVVDDEATIGAVVRRALSSEHDVVAVNRGHDALALLQAGQRFDLILCDLMMPEMTGAELHAQLQQLSPVDAARMVFLTGGAFSQQARRFLDEVENECIEKPFDIQHLRDVVRRLVG